MTQRVALVTGGTGGIGTAISQELYQEGYTVVAAYYKNGNHDAAKAWQKEQKEKGYDIHINYANLSDFNECEGLAAQVVEKFGQIDVLVNNAGRIADSSLKKMTEEQWKEVIDNNLNSVFNLTRHVINYMLNNQYGRIINISSINGYKGQFGQCNYSSSKAALSGFTKSLALEVAKKNITVNSVSPGYIKTNMLEGVDEKVMDAIVSQIPVGRLGSPEEVARVVSFLADEASSFITGSNVAINGGQYM